MGNSTSRHDYWIMKTADSWINLDLLCKTEDGARLDSQISNMKLRIKFKLSTNPLFYADLLFLSPKEKMTVLPNT